jgi:hypothetical protein
MSDTIPTTPNKPIASTPSAITAFVPTHAFNAQNAFISATTGLIAGVLCGVMASMVTGIGYYFVIATPLAIGGIVGIVMGLGVYFSKNKNRWVSATSAAVAGIACVVTMHAANYSQFVKALNRDEPADRQIAILVREFEGRFDTLPEAIREVVSNCKFPPEKLRRLQVNSLGEYVHDRASAGVRLNFRSDDNGGIKLGYAGSFAYWLLEAVLIASVAGTLLWFKRSKPLCVQCNEWRSERTLGSVFVDAKRVADLIQQGNFDALKFETSSERATELKIYRCPECCSIDSGVLEVVNVDESDKSKTEKRVAAFVVSDKHVENLAEVFAQADNDFAILEAIEEASVEIRESIKKDKPVETTDDSNISEEQAEKVLEEYMSRLLKKND